MPILIVSINHGHQIAPLKDELLIPEVMGKKEGVRAFVAEAIAARAADLICEESDPRHLSIAQELAFTHSPRIPWINIYMTSQERLEAGIWEQLLYRPFEIDHEKGITIESRVPQDDARENFFRDEILKAAQKTGAKSILVLCGDMHTEALKTKLEASGQQVQTNHDLVPEKHWK